jgi:hypothetical protein
LLARPSGTWVPARRFLLECWRAHLATETKEMMMSQRNFVLGSVASLALAGGMLAALPGYGQALPRYPTPDEQAQTQALNAEQASAAATTTVIVAANPADPDSSAVIAQTSAAQAQYDAQLKDYRDRADARLRDYQDKTSAYEKQKRDYDTLLDRYEQDHSGTAVVVAPPAAEVVVAPPDEDVVVTAPATVIAHDRLVNFDDLRDPDRELAGVPVEDRAGYLVGHFRHLTYQGGSEEAVITLHNNKTVVLDDEHLRFDPVNDVVVADLSFNELNSMPARF